MTTTPTPVYEITMSVLTWSHNAQRMVAATGHHWHAVNPVTGRTYCGRTTTRAGQETTNPRRVTCNTCAKKSGAAEAAWGTLPAAEAEAGRRVSGGPL